MSEKKEDLINVLDEMERSTSDSLRAQRASTRHIIHSKVAVRPANISDRSSWTRDGTSSDISSNGSKVLLSRPIMVGDMFFLTFESECVHVPPVYARCMRCRLLNEEAFEVGFKFLTPVEIVNRLEAEDDEPDLI